MLAQHTQMVVNGWYDEEWLDYHSSETQGVELDYDKRDALKRDATDDDILNWLHREESDEQIITRWFKTDEEAQDEMIRTRDEGDENVWMERMTSFRAVRLHRLLTEYFGTANYTQREIVLRWTQEGGKWKPAEKMNVIEWIESRIEEKGTMIAGYASCGGTIQRKIAARRKKEGKGYWASK